MKTLIFAVSFGLAAVAGAAPEATVTITRPQGDAFDIVVKLVIRPEAS